MKYILFVMVACVGMASAFSENPADYELFGLMAPLEAYETMDEVGCCLSFQQLALWADAITKQGAHDKEFISSQLDGQLLDHSIANFASAANVAYIVEHADIPKTLKLALSVFVHSWKETCKGTANVACELAIALNPKIADPSYWQDFKK